MPLYDYMCKNCGNVNENVIHNINETPQVICGKCKSLMVRRIGLTNVIFKGIGWGKDGYDKQSVKKIMNHKKRKPRKG